MSDEGVTRLVCTGCGRPHSKVDSARIRKELGAAVRAWPLGDYPFEHGPTKTQAASLERRGLVTIGDLLEFGWDRLVELPGFGPATVERLKWLAGEVVKAQMEWASVKRTA